MRPIDLSVAAARRALDSLAGYDGEVDDEGVVRAHARVVWSALTEPGDRVAGALISAAGPVRALEVAMADGGGSDEAAAADLSPDELAAGRARWMPRAGGVARPLELARRTGVRLLTPEDAAWPTRADDLGPYAPLCLWVLGDPHHLGAPGPAVALVGARAASSYGEHVAGELAAESAGAGIAVYSGAAYGIDAAAHAATLGAGGVTIAVMAGGLERPYPVGNRDLIERISRAGAVVAEVPCGTAPTKHRFLARNRIIAALSDATVVVEAGWRSGSLNTAHHAQAIGRPVGVVPGPITSAASMGCHRLLREGDAVCVTGIHDVRELLGAQDEQFPVASGGCTDDRTRALDALSARSPRSIDEIARRAGFAAEEAAALLGLLELEGAVVRRGAGWVQVTAGVTTLW